MPYEATIKETGEKISVYKLNDGNYYDYDKMGEHEIAQSKTGKKKFSPDELIIGKEIPREN